jgi:hypothetical protein
MANFYRTFYLTAYPTNHPAPNTARSLSLIPVKVRLSAAICVAVSAAAMPSASADPQQFPDLSGFVNANAPDYTTYSAYMTAGVQFVTPAGYRCRMSYTTKAARSDMGCWGSLPGTSHNYVGLRYLGGPNSPGAEFSDIDLTSMERYDWMDASGTHEGTISPDSYKALPAHAKVTYTQATPQTCGVDSSLTACVLTGDAPGQRHGFVLSPQGSWTF